MNKMKRNINYFILELQKAFRLKPLLISVIGIYITMFLTIWRELPYYQEFDVLYCFQYARTEGFYLIFLLFAAIPYTRAFVHDFQNKSYRLLLVRARSTLTYSISKVFSCFLSSGTAIIVSQLFFIFTLRFFCPLVDTQGAAYCNLADSLLFGAAFKNGRYLVFFMYIIVLKAVGGAFLSVVALAFSTYISNGFTILTIPIIAYYLLTNLSAFLPYTFQLNRVMQGEAYLSNAQSTFMYGIGYFLCLTFIVGYAFWARVKRKVEND